MTKFTILHDEHIKLGAKMVDFAGWHMPVQYTSIIEEHKTVRNSVGIFDVSHMGELIVQGSDSIKFLNKIVPQDISKLTDSKAIYCQLTNKTGGIKDDWIVYKLEDNYMVSRMKHDEQRSTYFVKSHEKKNPDYELFQLGKDNALDVVKEVLSNLEKISTVSSIIDMDLIYERFGLEIKINQEYFEKMGISMDTETPNLEDSNLIKTEAPSDGNEE